jgi:hypothetical protein
MDTDEWVDDCVEDLKVWFTLSENSSTLKVVDCLLF